MTPLLALHGFTGSPASWDFLSECAPRERLTPALVGHAGAEAASGVTNFEAEVARLAGMAARAGKVHLVGYSLGARLALGVALHRPEVVARLSLLSGQPGLESLDERAARRAADAVRIELLTTRGLSAFVDAWQAQPMWASLSALPVERRAQKRRERLSHQALGLAHSLRATGLAEMPSYSARLSELRLPVDLVAGELDDKFCGLARAMAERVPHAALHIVRGVGHDLLLECPDFIGYLLDQSPEA